MSYVDGFILPIPKDNVEAYRAISAMAGALWKEHGALLYKEAMLDDTHPDWGMVEFPTMSGAKAGETVIIAFILFNSREHRDDVNAKVMADPRLAETMNKEDMPFDMKRMAYGGFKAIVDL